LSRVRYSLSCLALVAVVHVRQGASPLGCVPCFPPCCELLVLLWNDLGFVGVCQAPNSEVVPLKQDRRPVWVASFARVALLMLLLTVGGVSASKLRSWSKYPDLNPWAIGKPIARIRHKMVTGSDGALWSFGGRTESGYSGELFKLDVETKQWTTITTSGVSPSARWIHTMGSTDGFLWVFGGYTDLGEGREGACVAVLATCSVSVCMWWCVRIVTCACHMQAAPPICGDCPCQPSNGPASR
jgi:hypothetical protein